METAINAPFSTPVSLSKNRTRLGLAVSSLPVAFLIFDTVIKLAKIDAVTEAFDRMGYPQHLARGIGWLEAACLLLYVVPRTSDFDAFADRRPATQPHGVPGLRRSAALGRALSARRARTRDEPIFIQPLTEIQSIKETTNEIPHDLHR